jgi:hypothetical protein
MGKEKKIVARISITTVDKELFRTLNYTKVYDQETSFRTLVNWAQNKLEDLDEVHGVKHMLAGISVDLED